MAERLQGLRLEPVGSTSSEFKAFLDEQLKGFTEMVRLAGVKPE